MPPPWANRFGSRWATSGARRGNSPILQCTADRAGALGIRDTTRIQTTERDDRYDDSAVQDQVDVCRHRRTSTGAEGRIFPSRRSPVDVSGRVEWCSTLPPISTTRAQTPCGLGFPHSRGYPTQHADLSHVRSSQTSDPGRALRPGDEAGELSSERLTGRSTSWATSRA